MYYGFQPVESPPHTLEDLGWDSSFAAAFDSVRDPGVVPGRVGIEHNHIYRVYTSAGLVQARRTGSLQHAARGADTLPAVGDWVALRTGSVGQAGQATIRHLLKRRSAFSRKAAGDPTRRQVVAANVDTVLLVSGLDDDFNLRRIERYLVAAAESGASPVVVLNKADVCDDLDAAADAVRSIAPAIPIHLTSCTAAEGLAPLETYLVRGRTVALLGSSGVGKSTIINRLLGEDRQRVREVRQRDRRGRHTTVHRELIVRAAGGVIIDTPGMRELQPWDTDQALEGAFKEIDHLAADCHFRDCQHDTEPRCAVRQAVTEGRLSASRLDHYRQLRAERAHLNRRRDEGAALAQKRRTKTPQRAIKALDRHPKRRS